MQRNKKLDQGGFLCCPRTKFHVDWLLLGRLSFTFIHEHPTHLQKHNLLRPMPSSTPGCHRHRCSSSTAPRLATAACRCSKAEGWDEIAGRESNAHHTYITHNTPANQLPHNPTNTPTPATHNTPISTHTNITHTQPFPTTHTTTPHAPPPLRRRRDLPPTPATDARVCLCCDGGKISIGVE